MISEEFLVKVVKTYYTVTLELEDLAFAVSPVCRFLGDLFREQYTLQDQKRQGESSKYLEVMKVSQIRSILVKFFFHNNDTVRGDLFYMLSGWLLAFCKSQSASKSTKEDIRDLLRMYLVGIYTEKKHHTEAQLV